MPKFGKGSTTLNRQENAFNETAKVNRNSLLFTSFSNIAYLIIRLQGEIHPE